MQVDATTPPGTYLRELPVVLAMTPRDNKAPLTVTQNLVVEIVVTGAAQADFTVTNPTAESLHAGNSAQFSMLVTPKSGFSGTMPLAGSAITAAGVAVLFPGAVTLNGSPVTVVGTVTDAAGLAVMKTAQVVAYPVPMVSVFASANPAPTGSMVTFSTNVTGGTPPYRYYRDGPLQSTASTATCVTATGMTYMTAFASVTDAANVTTKNGVWIQLTPGTVSYVGGCAGSTGSGAGTAPASIWAVPSCFARL